MNPNYRTDSQGVSPTKPGQTGGPISQRTPVVAPAPRAPQPGQAAVIKAARSGPKR